MLSDYRRYNNVPLGGYEKKQPFSWRSFFAALLFVMVVFVMLSVGINSLNLTYHRSPIIVGEYEKVWFQNENATSTSVSLSNSHDVIPTMDTIWLDTDAHAIVKVPWGMSSDLDHPFVRSIPTSLHHMMLDAMELFIGSVLLATMMVQLLIVSWSSRRLLVEDDGDLFFDAVEPPVEFGMVPGNNFDLVGAVIDQVRVVAAYEWYLRDLLADGDGDVFLAADLPDVGAVVEPAGALDAGVDNLVGDDDPVKLLMGVLLFWVLLLLVSAFDWIEWMGAFMWDPGGGQACWRRRRRSTPGVFTSRDGCLLLVG